MTPIADLTVAISTRDRPRALARCLAALVSGRVLPAEIVIVDQSRDDATRRLVEQEASGPIPIRYVAHAGSGLGASQNIAIAHAKCPVVAVTDDDCVPTADWVATIAQAFASANAIDVLTGRILPLGPDEPGLYAVSSRTSTSPAEFDRTAMPWDVGSGNNFAARREWLDRIGGNDERLGPGSPGKGGVDMDLFYRLVRAGARVRYEPASLVYHERTSKAGRLARRVPYGYGMGACCSLWLRQKDRGALRVFRSWLGLRMRRLRDGLRRRDWLLVYAELLVLGGTLRGVVYGLRAGDRT